MSFVDVVFIFLSLCKNLCNNSKISLYVSLNVFSFPVLIVSKILCPFIVASLIKFSIVLAPIPRLGVLIALRRLTSSFEL